MKPNLVRRTSLLLLSLIALTWCIHHWMQPPSQAHHLEPARMPHSGPGIRGHAPQPSAPPAAHASNWQAAPASTAPAKAADATALLTQPALQGHAPHFGPAKSAAHPLDALKILETLDETWPEGAPTRAGWHPRVRIVRADFKCELLRIEELVEVALEGENPKFKSAHILRACDANYILASSTHGEMLAALGIPSIPGGTPQFLKVPIEHPETVTSLPNLVGRLKGHGLNQIEPNAIIAACAQPNDSLHANGNAWHLENLGLLPGHRVASDIHASAAWDTRTDASSVLIAVIDSGITTGDPELAPSIHTLAGETLGDGEDNDGNGYADDLFGYDFYHRDANPDDEAGHGSMCAALIGAAGNNGFGSTGVAWKASILSCKFLNRDGLGELADAIEAIDYARSAGANILNLSWSYDGDAALLADALGRCDAAGVLIVCASGNSGWASPVPAPASIRLPHLVAVAASTASDTLAPFSVVDPKQVHLAAPGVDLPIALHYHPWDPLAETSYATGTSFSAAVVSGSLALALAEFPTEPPGTVIRRMLESVDPIEGGSIAMQSGGRINLARLLGNHSVTPPGDLFAERLVLTDPSGQWTGRNNGAGTEPLDASLGMTPPPVKSIWFEWTAAADGLLRVEPESTDGSPLRLAVFAKSDGHPGSLIARTTNSMPVEIPVVAGQELLWLLDSTVEITQGLSLTWQLPPTNDNWQSASLATGIPLTLSGNSLGATVESFELSKPHYPSIPQGSVWWRWSPGQTGSFSIDTTAGHFTFVLPLNHGKPDFPPDYGYTNLIERRCNVELGKTYAILVIPQTPASAGPFSVSLLGDSDLAIVAQPADTATLAGETVELEVQYAAAHRPSFQWFKDGKAIPFATWPILKLSPVTERSFGNYHVLVSNNRTTLQSHTAVVSPRFERPRLTHQTPPRSVVAGQVVDLNATFRSATEISYSWRKNGQLIAAASTQSLLLSNCTTGDTGTYQLTASNPAGSTVVTFQVNVSETPWKGWAIRTPGYTGRGPIQDVELNGSIASAFTPTEWLRSTDGGNNWSSTTLPANFVADHGASSPDGEALVSGGSFTAYGSYLQDAMWKFTAASGWQPVEATIIPPSGPTVTVKRMQRTAFFDGKWWATVFYDYSNRLAFSTDGITWNLVADPADPSKAIRATKLFRCSDCLAISFWKPDSKQTVQLRFPGGGTKILNFGNTDARSLARIGNSCYLPYFNKTLKITDDQANAVTIAADNLFDSSSLFEGTSQGNSFIGLEITPNTTAIGTGKLRTVVSETTASVRTIGFECFARSGGLWLVGYPDGRLWSGTDLSQLPLWSQDYSSAGVLNAYANEFTYGKFHSSDGAQWQMLGAATNRTYPTVTPFGQAGDKFLHAIRENGTSSPIRKFISDAIYPSALGQSDGSEFPGSVWSGDTYLLSTRPTGGPLLFDLIREQAPGISIQTVTPTVACSSVSSAAQWNGRWFVRGSNLASAPTLITSTNGTTWTSSSLPQPCVLGRKGNTLIAIENSTRGYFSTTGTSWTPFTPQGLPVLNQINQPAAPTEIASYRGYFVAQYGQMIYASADGISWSLGTIPLPVSYLKENRHTLLAVTQSGQILQPSGEIESGPVVSLPESQQLVTVSRNQAVKYEVSAEDADGDLVSVTCLLDGAPVSTLTKSPFVFSVTPASQGAHAVEFVARDQVGRISRVTASLTVLDGGVRQTSALVIDSDLSKAVCFMGDYYRIHTANMNQQAVVCIWEGGDRWRPVSPANHKVFMLTANRMAMVASTATGILVSQDGVNWTHHAGFDPITPQGPIVYVDHDLLKVQGSLNRSFWTSMDGLSWTRSENPPPVGPTGTVQKVVWADANFGLSESNQITSNGGQTWTTILASTFTSTISVKDGFLSQNGSGIYRISRNENAFTPVEYETSWPRPLYISKVDGLAFIGGVGRFLRSTEDGIHFSNHSPPPNETPLSLMRFGGEWLAISDDMICCSKDLKSWKTLLDFHRYGYTTEQLRQSGIKVARDGLDGLFFDHPRFPQYRFALDGNLTITRLPAPTYSLTTVPTGRLGGLRFKNRTIALDDWYFTRADHTDTWERAPLTLAPDLQPQVFFPSTWPTRYFSDFTPTALFAATDQRYITLTPYRYSTTRNYVITTDDGVNFVAHDWSAPIPLSDVRCLAASPSLFLAAATNGRILRSSDGLHWTEHQTSPTTSITGLLFFNGRWHASATQGYSSPEIWSSPDGISWSRTFTAESSDNFELEIPRNAFVAKGVARMYAGRPGWLRSSDGLTWQIDQVLNQSVQTNNFKPQSEHPEGIIGGGSQIVIVDHVSGNLIRKISTGFASLSWLDGTPYLSSLGSLSEWTESDPRLTGISATSGTFGIGDHLDIDLTSAELEDPSSRIRLLLSVDPRIGNADDIVLALPKWTDGVPQQNGARRFTVALPPSLAPGRFMVAARLVLPEGTKDSAIENNQILTAQSPVEVPGYELRLTTTGEGEVTSDNPRPIYPQGSRLQLLAVARPGSTFRAWSGSQVSQQSSISVVMDADKDLAVSFTAGYRTSVRPYGLGSVTGAPPDGVVLPGDSLHLTQSPGPGWKAGGWRINGVPRSGTALSYQPDSDTVIDAVFIPDFAAWKTSAFSSAGAGIDDSWDGDPDHDGLNNWQELLLSTNPLGPGGIAQMVEKSPSQLRLVFKRPQGPPDRPWVTPEHSGSLIDWLPADALNMIERVLDVRDGIETVELTLPIKDDSHGFFRLRMDARPAGL